MRKIILLFALAFSITQSFAQDNGSADGSERKVRSRCSKFYIDASTGINNNGGLISVGGDLHVSSDISINAGVGLSSWGNKLYIGGKGYLKPCHKGWAFGGGLTYSTGVSHYYTKLPTITGQEELVDLQLKPQANIFAAAYKYWRLGRKNNRIFLELGWSNPILTEKFKQLSGSPITSQSASVMKFISPHGPIIGFGFSFGT